MKIHEILVEFQLQKNQWAVDISNDAKQEVSGDLIHLVQTAYAGTPRGSFVNNVSNILPSDWAILDFDDEPDVDSAVFYRGPRPGESWTGFKIQGLGHDGTKASKDHSLSRMVAMLNRPGWWIESSGTLRGVLANRGCNIVQDPATLQSLFPDTGLEMINQNTYTRQLPDGASITETVFGHPKVSLSEDIIAADSKTDLRTMLADVREEMEAVDDASMGSQEGDANYAGLSRDYSALLAIENVIKNNLKAIKNNVMDNNIFMYDYDGDIDEIAAIHVEMSGPVAHVKWLGSYNSRGGELYRAAMQEARRRGATSVEVEAKWNSDGFYRKMGLDTTQPGEYNPFTDSQLNKMAGPLSESAIFLNPNTVIVGQAHGQPLELSPDTLKKIQSIAAKHGAWYEGNGTDRGYTRGQIDKYAGSWDDEVAKTASPNDPKWLYVLFANVDENNRVRRVGVDPQDTIFNRLLATAKDNSFQGIGFTSQALQKFLSMASEGKYDFVKMSQQPATQENLSRFLKAGESLMWPGNWEQYPNRAGKIAKAATVDVRDQYLATRKAGVYVTGSGHLKAVQNITGRQNVQEETLEELTGIKSIVNKLPKPRGSRFDPLGVDWHTVLNNYGFKVLGYGSFGVVWENPKLPYVLKVFSANDSAYIDWISVARQNKNNPHMPRFVSARLLTITPEVLAIRMEKLFPVINQEKNVVFESAMLLQERYNPSEQINSVGFDTDQRNLRYYCQTNPTWLPALDIVKNFSNNSGYRLDFHNKNVMMRDADTLVITDPVYNREDLAGR